MFRTLWKSFHPAVCSLSFYSSSGIRIESLTGFKVKGRYLLTDSCIFNMSKAETVKLTFFQANGHKEQLVIEMAYETFLDANLAQYNGEVVLPFALILLQDERFVSIPSLKLSDNMGEPIGSSLAILGYHAKNNNLTIRRGMLSSYCEKSDGREYIQFDSSVVQGSGGAPVIDVESGTVTGMVGCRLAALSQNYKQLKQILSNNIAILKKSQGKFMVHEVDPVQVLIANQNQIKFLADEMFKTANISVGYALKINYVIDFLQKIEKNLRSKRTQYGA